MIDAGFVPDNLIEIMWLGQSGFLLRTAASAVVIDLVPRLRRLTQALTTRMTQGVMQGIICGC